MPPPLDATLYLAAGPRLYSYDNYQCLLEVTPQGGCPAPFVALDYSSPALLGLGQALTPSLYAASAAQVYAHPADPAAPACGAPQLPPDAARAITSLRAAAAGLYYVDRSAVYFAGWGLAPVALVQDGAPGAGFEGVRSGLALWGGSGAGAATLFYGAAGTLGGERFRGVLAARADTGAGFPEAFFRYSNNASQASSRFSPSRLALVGGTLAWTEVRASADPGGLPSAAVQATALTPPASHGSVNAVVTQGEFPLGLPPLSAAGDAGPAGATGGGALWWSLGPAVSAVAAGPVRVKAPLFSLDLGALGAVTGLAFARGSPACGYAFAYSPAQAPPLQCAPQPRAPVSLACRVAPPAVVDAVVAAPWPLALGVALGAAAALGALVLCLQWLHAHGLPCSCARGGSGGGAAQRAGQYAVLNAPGGEGEERVGLSAAAAPEEGLGEGTGSSEAPAFPPPPRPQPKGLDKLA